MTPEKVTKNIKQMRSIFAFLGVVMGISALLNLFGEDGYFLTAVIAGTFSFVFWMAFVNLGKRNKKGYTFAQVGSIILLLGFPVFTIFGIMYLNKLSKPEMKAALSDEAPVEAPAIESA